MSFFHALGGVFSLLIVVAAGFFLGMRGWFAPECRKMIPRLVTNVSLPPFLACTIITHMQRDNLLHMLWGTFPPFIAMGSLFILAWFAARIMRVPRKRFGLFCACISNPNTIFIGIPVNMALFGPEAVPFVLLYYFASTTFFWTVGNYFISRDEGAQGGESAAKHAKGIHWNRIVSAPMYGFMAGLIIVCADIEPPRFMFSAAQVVGELTTPLALIFIGLTLQGMGLRNIHITRDMGAALFGRMVLSPFLIWLILPFFGLPSLMEKVFVVQSGLPVLMQVAILSAYYNTDPDFGSLMVSVSTILCVITVPVIMVLL